MSNSDSPVAPPDPWKKVQQGKHRGLMGIHMYHADDVDAALATERQSHAELLASVIAKWTRTVADLQESHAAHPSYYAQLCEDFKINPQKPEHLWQMIKGLQERVRFTESFETTQADLTAARAETARLTEQRDSVLDQSSRNFVALYEQAIAIKRTAERAEVAEASLLALQQQMETLIGRWSLSANPSDWERSDELASSLTGRSQ